MEIIKFPLENKKLKDIVTKDTDSLGVNKPFKFSCDCGEAAEFAFKNIVFKQIDFFCAACGAHYKVTNPAFKAPPTTPIKKK